MFTGFTTLFFNISGGELFVILLVVFIVFGPAKIPEIARSLGRMMNEVKKASSDISREFRQETAAIERNLKKTTSEVIKEVEPLTDSLKRGFNTDAYSEAEKIPEVYQHSPEEESAKEDHEMPNKEKTEKPIQ